MLDADTDWLPLARQGPLEKHVSMNMIKTEKHKDWFMNLADAIINLKGHATQGRMLAKAFFFLRDFLPDGLTGDFSHIQGDNVMQHLLCHDGEHSVSRHRVTRDAEVAFSELERWMQRGKDWQEALKMATPRQGRQRGGSLAPGLHTPAGLLAVLIIAHPDAKFRTRVGRLGIQWMLQSPRESLEVKDGFWKGIHSGNVCTCFRAEEQRSAEVSLLADYTALFGEGFVRSRKDMRPFLPSWACDLRLEVEPDELFTDGEEAQDPSLSDLHRHMSCPGEDPVVLESWLVGQLAEEKMDWPGHARVLSLWCDHWAGRMSRVTGYQEQRIVRSLFLQSLGRLKSLWSSWYTYATGVSAETTAFSYMLLDIEDAGLKARVPDPEITKRLMKAASFSQFTDTVIQLAELIGQQRALFDKLVAQQSVFFWELMRDTSLAKLANSVMELDTLRSRVLIRQVKGSKRTGHSEDASRTGILQANGDTLKLTNWQIRQLALPGAVPDTILTGDQLGVYRQDAEAVAVSSLDLSDESPLTPERPGSDGESPHMQRMLRELFGSLRRDLDAPGGQSVPAPSTPSSPTVTVRTTRSQPVRDTSIPQGSELPRPRAPETAGSPAPHALELTAGSVRGAQNGQGHSTTFAAGADTGLTPGPEAAVLKLFAGRQAGVKRSANGQPKTPGSSWTDDDDIDPLLNLFAGKQAGVRRDTQSTSKPITRLWGMTREDLKADITGEMDGLRQEMQTMREELSQNLAASQAAIQTRLESDVQALRRDIGDLQTNLATIINSTDVEDRVKDVLVQLQAIRDDVALPPPSLGKDGYLATQCPAPDGWSQQSCKSWPLVLASALMLTMLCHRRYGPRPSCLVLREIPSCISGQWIQRRRERDQGNDVQVPQPSPRAHRNCPEARTYDGVRVSVHL